MVIQGEQRFRVYNRCKYDIGVTLLNGAAVLIRAGSFQLLTVNDMLFIDSICAKKKFFSCRMLVPVNDAGEDVPIENIGLYVEDTANKHLADDEIANMLKQSVKKIETWIAEINDPVQLDAIYNEAKKLDLPSSKIKLLSAKMPEKDWIND